MQFKSAPESLQSLRRDAMAVLAEGATDEIAARLNEFGAMPPHTDMRKGENGLVMVRGRMGGDGAPFNLGEATVSRAAIRLDTGEVGFGYALGRDGEKARLIACCDALIQRGEYRDAIERVVLAPIRARLDAERRTKMEQAAATKVEFFTLVRGED